MRERDAYLLLNKMEQVGPVMTRRLLNGLGSVTAVFTEPESVLRSVAGVGPATVAAIVRQRDTLDAAEEEARAAAFGAHILTVADPGYPEPLRQIYDPPLALYVQGRLLARDAQALAVVGTRRPTHYGRGVAQQLTRQAARAGITIASGLALGIDTVAHEAALAAGGRTLAVLGGALDHLYPSSNRKLANAIVNEHGAVLSEFPFGRRPDRTTFPMRNRVVSGLSRAVLVIEAGVSSGALITARCASEQGREVLAVPGRIDSPQSSGTHALLRDGARLVTSIDDVLTEFESLLPRSELDSKGPETVRKVTLSTDEQRIMELVRDGEDTIDGLVRQLDVSIATLNALLLGLEMKRCIKVLPGRRLEALY